MANKKGVIMYYDVLEQLEDFNDSDFRAIIEAIIKYDKDKIEPNFTGEKKLAFKFIKLSIDRNNEEYAIKCEKNRENIQKRWNKNNTNEYDCIGTNTNDTYKDKDKDKDIDKVKKKKKEKEKTIDDLLKLQPIELQSNLKDFLKMRKSIKKPMTTRAFELLLKDLDKLANDNETKNKILEQSILHSWQGVFELKENKQPKQQSEEKPDLTKRRFDTDGVELFYVEGKWYRLDSQMFKYGLTCLEDGRCIQNGKLL